MFSRNDQTGITRLSADRIDKTLKQVFGVTFDIRPVTDATADGCQSVGCNGQQECSEDLHIAPLGDNLWRLVYTHIVDSARPYQAAADVEALNRDSVVRMARCGRELLKQQESNRILTEQLEYFVHQVSGDLEEACWFRTMAEEVAECLADDPLAMLCERVLPRLRKLVYARSVMVLIDAEQADHDAVVVGYDSEADGQPYQDQVARQIVSRFGQTNDGSAVVRNSAFQVNDTAEQNALLSRVSGFVLVRIGTQQRNFGWLVALERQNPVKGQPDSRCSESEFGTHEATLMETAAVLLATHASNCQLFLEQENTLVGVVTAMVNAIDARDPYTHGHSQRVALVGQRIGQELGLDEETCEEIYLSGLLHDIGKIGVADHVLLKNGPLNMKERRQIEQHTVIGHSILCPVKKLAHVLPGVLHHHERFDGTGYPGRLHADDIPLPGRILAVADAYDAMTTSRPYRSAMSVDKAEAILIRGAGSQWDDRVLQAFFAARADIETIYREDRRKESVLGDSMMQYGRFEDVSQGHLEESFPLSTCGQ